MVSITSRRANTDSTIGELQLWINGISVIHVSGLIFREDQTSLIKGMHFQTFFGGA